MSCLTETVLNNTLFVRKIKRTQLKGQFTEKLIVKLNFGSRIEFVTPLTNCQKYSEEEL